VQVAIDGPSASGKSTVGRALAQAMGWPFLDTGLMYRAVALRALQSGVDVADAAALAEIARDLTFDLMPDGLRIDGSPAGPELHSPAVDVAVSPVSAHPEVRELLVRRQRELAGNSGIVMAGRDIGTVVLPYAPVKLWITASEEERARRRGMERSTSSDGDRSTEAARLNRRDRQDSGRAASPLRQADDAIAMHTDGLLPGEVVDRAVELVRAAIPTEGARGG
jgi:cytidylate kinase